MVKAIVLDYAEVVAEGPMTKWIRENIEPDDNRLEGYKENAKLWDTGQMAVEEVYEILAGFLHIKPEEVWETLYEKSNANEDVLNLIRKLKGKYKIILFSNFVSELLRKLLAHYKITDLFDEIIISSEHKVKKPSPEFFKILVEKSGFKKDELVFFDDKQRNIDASNAFGINAFRFQGIGQMVKDLKSVGVEI